MSSRVSRLLLASVAVLAVGAGLVYFLHPAHGPRRRQRVSSASRRWAGKLAETGCEQAVRLGFAMAEPELDPMDHLEDFAEPGLVTSFPPARPRVKLGAVVLAGLVVTSLAALLAPPLSASEP